MLTVKVFSAGDHYHHQNEEAEDLIAHLLEKSGYTSDLVWECRIDKMRTCSHTSPPVRMVHFKPYAVVMRIKTTPDSNTDQQVTLQIPSGTSYKAEKLFDQLKNNVKSISRQWRKEVREKKVSASAATMQIPAIIKEKSVSIPVVHVHEPKVTHNRIATHVPDEPVSKVIERPEFPNLQGITDNLKKLKYVLSKIHLLSRDEHEGKADYLDRLVKECGWDKEHHLLRMCSRVLTLICDNGYAMPHVNSRNKVITYNLTEEGCAVLGIKPDDKPSVVPQKSPVVEKPVDVVRLLIDSREKVQELADAGRRLDANSMRRAELQQQIAVIQSQIAEIDKEDAEITKVITNPEACTTLARLTSQVSVLGQVK